MSRLSFSLQMLVATGLFLTGASVFDSPASAQQPAAPDPVRIVTVDGVRLTGHFYASSKRNAPAVIMLHPIGDGKSSKSQEWKALAEALQKANYSVITFDFRGHGESTSFDSTDAFWAQPANKSFVKLKVKEELDVKDYIKNNGYASALVNDIAAIKAYLDRKNDEGACNTANTIVIGADNGATLGALWINSEWNRYKYTPPMPPMSLKGMYEKRPEGSDVLAGIFLTAQSTLAGSKTVSVTGLLNNACKTHGMAALFFYGKEDAKAKTFNKTLEKNLKVKDSKKHEFIAAVELDTNLSGMKLLQKGLKIDKKSVNEAIVEYLDAVVAEKGREWGKRDFEGTYFMWRHPSTGFAWPAKQKKGEKNLNFDLYDKFIAN